MKIPSHQEFRNFIYWFFKIDFSRTRENGPRLITQTALFTITLVTTGWFLYKCMASRSCSSSSTTKGIKGVVDKIFGKSNETKEKPATQTPFKKWELNDYGNDTRKIKVITTFGSEINMMKVLDKEDKENLSSCLVYFLQGIEQFYIDCKKLFCNGLKEKKELAYVDLFITTDLDGWFLVTIEVVEKKDIGMRSLLDSVPKSREPHQDPGDLLTTMQNYLNLGATLAKRGEIKPDKSDKIQPPWYSPYGHGHDNLKAFRQTFIDGVIKHRQALTTIFLNDEKDSNAIRALFVLVYMADVDELMRILQERMHDENEEIRKNIFAVFKSIAKTDINMESLIPDLLISLQYPCILDRTAAIDILNSLLSRKDLSEENRSKIQNGLKYNATLIPKES
ncbi:MAG: hypothetical protein L0207_03410 [Chlamydiae bacterium]|nr:hypothetical protein [Chlamydiota bacterium]